MSITGFSEKSIADYFSKIECNFIEKYLKYIIMDECVPSFFLKSNQNIQSIFVPSKKNPY